VLFLLDASGKELSIPGLEFPLSTIRFARAWDCRNRQKDVTVSPSPRSHFFQSITSFMVGYFTIEAKGFIDWDWIRKQKAVEERTYTKHISFNLPIVIKINGHSNQGIILKAGAA
jgi:hypothetical protein